MAPTIATPAANLATPAPACPVCGETGTLRDDSTPSGLAPCWRCAGIDSAAPDPKPASVADPEPEPTATDRAWWAALAYELARGDRTIFEHDHDAPAGPSEADWADYHAARPDPGDDWPESERIAVRGHLA